LLPVRLLPDLDFRMLQLRDRQAENCRTGNNIALNWDWPFGNWDRTSVNNFGIFMQCASPFRLPKLRIEATILCV
jgi:hypothetical protein